MKRIPNLRARRLSGLVLVGAMGLTGSVAMACGDDSEAAKDPGERTIYFQATEQDARRAIAQTAFPQETRDGFAEYFGPADKPTESGGAPGYYLFQTSDTEWRVGSYMFLPHEIVAYEGEKLTFEILGVRGDEHQMVLTGPDGEVAKDTSGKEIKPLVKRGGLGVVEFVAGEPGVYSLVCTTHAPNMTAYIHVLE